MKDIRIIFFILIFIGYFSGIGVKTEASFSTIQNLNVQTKPLSNKDLEGNTLYQGTIYHVFFHSLIIYPKLAFDGSKYSSLFKNYMITRDEFNKILPELYKNNFIIIDIKSLYAINKDGTVVRKPIYLPEGKKPLIISLDDLAYYYWMLGHGFANKLVLDKNGEVATEVINPLGKIEVTRDGDVIPLLDDFIKVHPDFSFHGAKGLIAVTGYQGVLGYRTDSLELKNHPKDFQSAKMVIDKLKNTGWQFASHSYSHQKNFTIGTLSLKELKKDTELWKKEVEPLVGSTDIFIGPFGQIFNNQNDLRRVYLVSQGFKMFCGVGLDLYLNFYSNSITMDRADIDGYRLFKTPYFMTTYFNPTTITLK